MLETPVLGSIGDIGKREVCSLLFVFLSAYATVREFIYYSLIILSHQG